VAPLPNPK
jgi:hypothetical protein